MPTFEDLQRIDTRSQWLSSTLADLNGQQNPLSTPPRALDADAPGTRDPLGGSEDGHATAAHPLPGLAEIAAPSQAPEAAASAAPMITPPTLSEPGVFPPIADLPALAPSAAPAVLDHVGAAPRDTTAPLTDGAPTTLAEFASAAQNAAALQEQPAEFAYPTGATLGPGQSLVEALDGQATAPPPPLDGVSGEVFAFADMFDRLGDLFANEDDTDEDGLESALLEQASAQLSDVADSLFGQAAHADDMLPGMDDPAEPLTSGLEALVASMAADHPLLSSLLNPDLDPHHLLG